MNFSFALLFLQLGIVIGLKHAYLEELVHKALRPMFPEDFLNDFLEHNDFSEFSMEQEALDMWNQRALRNPKAVEKLKRLLQAKKSDKKKAKSIQELDFSPIFRDTYFVVAGLRPILKEDGVLQKDIVLECIANIRLLCYILAENFEVEFLEDCTPICHNFVLFVLSLHQQPHQIQTSFYFEPINRMFEETERSLLPVPNLPEVVVTSEKFEKMHLLAGIMLHAERVFGIKMNGAPFVMDNQVVHYSKALLRLVNYVHYHLARIKIIDVSTKTIETITEITASSLYLIVSHSLSFGLSAKQRNLLGNLLLKNINLQRSVRIEKIERQIMYHPTFLPLPLSIVRMLMREERRDNMDTLIRTGKIFRFLLDEAYGDRYDYEALLHMCKKLVVNDFPIEVFNLLERHLYITREAYKIDPKLVHYSCLCYCETSEMKYLENIAWWANSLISKQSNKVGMLLDFMTAEATLLFPSATLKLTLAFMLDGGYLEYSSTKYIQ